ncbi:MmyB family transcriptional regulator [Streptomyces sp. 6N106]|uniref:MmyB family transcriptional regulator n=1 Tax=Streptomyces sp. 6N106 TaxID=3457418 RepID=UPI003FD0AC67
MLDDLTATPAFVIGRRTDILAWNQLPAALGTDFGHYPEQERVFVRLLFTEPWTRELYADWEEVTRLPGVVVGGHEVAASVCLRQCVAERFPGAGQQASRRRGRTNRSPRAWSW